MSEVTRILSQFDSRDPAAADRLLPLIYDELRSLAAARLSQENPGHTLQATALVHEAYLRLVGQGDGGLSWDNRSHFFAAAAEAMRRILVEQARRKKSRRQGRDLARLDLDPNGVLLDFDSAEADRILALHEALTALEIHAPRKAQLVNLRFFAGMTVEQAARVLEISVTTAKRDWAAARVWLYRQMVG